MSFVGSIVGTQGEQVEVAFDIDKTAAGGNRYGFAPATGNLMYCMPQKGTKTSLYIGNGDEAQGIATGCIRTNGSTCEGTGSPEKKSFRSEHGKGMDLYPQRMGLDGGETGKITFEDETGTTIESNGGLVLMAKEGIRLESMTGIAMQGMSDIMALYAEGASSLCVNGSVDMLGRLAGISASKYTGYPPYDDAPKEGEFDWDGFTRNLAIGLGVVAVCAIGAAISIATFGAGSILAGAFIGAGIGALSTTAMKAGEEISTGNVRSAKEAFRDVGISAVSGFITGAFGAKFPGAHRLVEGVVDTVVSAGERYLYAVFDDSMSREEKRAYALDPRQMVADFVTGVVIGEFLDGITAAIQNKLRSIFANYDATMREALESGRESSIMDYSNRFADSLAEDFNPSVEVRDVVKEDMILVQFSSDAPNASLRYWTTIDEANGISTIEEYMDKMALSKEWGNRNVVKVARVKKGTEVTHAIGTAKAQTKISDPRPGNGKQILFSKFDSNWITEVRNIKE